MKHICLSLLIGICSSFFSSIIAQDTLIEIIPDTNKQSQTSDNEEQEVFLVVEVPPHFPGGENARIQFLIENIKYPQIARESGIQGTVYINFIVEADGSLTDIRVLRGIGGGCDEEALRVAKMMPTWVPGTQRGKAVRVSFNMPIKFILQSGRTEKKKQKKKRSKEEKDKLLY